MIGVHSQCLFDILFVCLFDTTMGRTCEILVNHILHVAFFVKLPPIYKYLLNQPTNQPNKKGDNSHSTSVPMNQIHSCIWDRPIFGQKFPVLFFLNATQEYQIISLINGKIAATLLYKISVSYIHLYSTY